jgi:hypothetical protein
MAKSKNNIVTHGLSGKIGNLLVFSQRHGSTVVSSVPRHSDKVSERQKERRRLFQRAVLYAQSVLASDSDVKAAYEHTASAKGRTTYNIAVADMLNAPDIKSIDLTGYTGQPNDVIRIEVTDDFAVKEVKVVITNIDGAVVEEGFAQLEPGEYRWTYKATRVNEQLDNDKIEIYASDIPGNISHKSEEL